MRSSFVTDEVEIGVQWGCIPYLDVQKGIWVLEAVQTSLFKLDWGWCFSQWTTFHYILLPQISCMWSAMPWKIVTLYIGGCPLATEIFLYLRVRSCQSVIHLATCCQFFIYRLVVQRIGYEHPQHVPHSIQLAHMSGELSLLPRGGAACLLSREIPRNMKASDRPKKVCEATVITKKVTKPTNQPANQHSYYWFLLVWALWIVNLRSPGALV